GAAAFPAAEPAAGRTARLSPEDGRALSLGADTSPARHRSPGERYVSHHRTGRDHAGWSGRLTRQPGFRAVGTRPDPNGGRNEASSGEAECGRGFTKTGRTSDQGRSSTIWIHRGAAYRGRKHRRERTADSAVASTIEPSRGRYDSQEVHRFSGGRNL